VRAFLPRTDFGAGPAPIPWTADRIAAGLSLGPFRGAVPCARLHAKHVLREWGVSGDEADAIELVVSELVTNAVQATCMLRDPVPAPVRLRIVRDAAHVLVEVADAVAARPAAGRPEDDDVHGRGLMIVGAVSKEWGAYGIPGGGKVVWARLPAA
jgi:Histidine kinase-like ATPase domain